MRRCAGTGGEYRLPDVARRRWCTHRTIECGAAYSRYGPFGNGDQRRQPCGPPHLLPRPWSLPTTLRPWSVPGWVVRLSQVKSSQVKSSQVKSSRAPRAAAGAHTCAARAGRGAPAIARRMTQTPAADAHRGTHPRPGAALIGRPWHRHPRGAHTRPRRCAQSSPVKSGVQKHRVLVFINTGGHAMRRIVP